MFKKKKIYIYIYIYKHIFIYLNIKDVDYSLEISSVGKIISSILVASTVLLSFFC